MKILFSSLAITFFFLTMLNYAFQPSSSREIASEKTDPSLAFTECLQENSKEGKISFKKSKVDRQNWAIVSADCLGEKAKALYDAVEPYAYEQIITLGDGRKGIGRFFGSLVPPSQCVRITSGAHGDDLNLYSCMLRFDLAHKMVQFMK